MTTAKRKRLFCTLLILCAALFAGVSALAEDVPALREYPLEYVHTVKSVGRYANWAGVSSVSQFADEKGNFCFAADEGERVTVCKTEKGRVTRTLSIENPCDTFGGAVCDSAGNLYMVWGRNNKSDDTTQDTIFVSKYTADGVLVSSVGGNGSEGLQSYYNSGFYSKTPFSVGNCDTAVSGDLLLVNYAREMYSGHQSNTVFVVNLKTMSVAKGITTYNSHSFDQRVTPYGKTGGFLLTSQGDCFPRCFATDVTDGTRTLNRRETFHFWVEKGAYSDYDMVKLNKTRARLGSILETRDGAALIGSSARSLSESAKTEPYDVFIQIFDPTKADGGPDSFFTAGTRSGIAGNDGDKDVTDYGVCWLTNLASSGTTADVVQAVSTEDGKIVVLYELYVRGRFDSTWYLLLDGDGTVLRNAVSLGNVRLNTDEDPVWADGAVQWAANGSGGTGTLTLYALPVGSAWPTNPTDPSAGKVTVVWQDSQGREAACREYSLSAAPGDGSAAVCVWYDRKGAALSVEKQSLPAAGNSTPIRFTLRSEAAELRLFFLDSALRPLSAGAAETAAELFP